MKQVISHLGKRNWCVKKKKKEEKPTHGGVNYLVAVVIVQRGEAGVGG